MRKILAAVTITALTLLPASQAAADPIGGTGWTMAFSDDFDGSTVDTAKWNYRTDVKAFSSQKAENVTLSGGVMSINLKQEADRGKSFTGGGLVSKAQLRYGYYETRARINTGTGWHTAFWLQCGDGKAANVSESGGSMIVTLKAESDRGKSFTGGGLITKQPLRYGYYETRVRTNTGPGWHTAFWNKYAPDGTTAFDPTAKTEIDGFEIDSVTPQNVRHNVIKWNGASYTVHATSNPYNVGFDTSAAFHTYGFEWAETYVKYYVDGVLKATQTYTPSQYTHDYAHLWLSVVATSYFGGYPDPAQLPAQVHFDYFRFWQKDFYVDNDGPANYGYSETGSWQASTLTGWTVGSPTRYAACASAGITATWRPVLAAAGTYQVFAYKVANANSDPNARYDVAGATTYVNQSSGSSGWVSLGTFSLPAGNGTAVTLTSSSSGCARADAVKFVRQP